MRFINVAYAPHLLQFKFNAGTSRGVMTSHQVWYVRLQDAQGNVGYGEIAPLPGLSSELEAGFEQKIITSLKKLIKYASQTAESTPVSLQALLLQCVPEAWSSIRFGLETALMQWSRQGTYEIFHSDFTQGKYAIPINGLIWMGSYSFMQQQAKEKPEAGFTCMKMKIGALNWSDELKILKQLRAQYAPDKMIIRVDANGSLSADNARKVFNDLAALQVHSIEQPFKPGQWMLTKQYIEANMVPIALDEELLGVYGEKQLDLLQALRPHYVVLKPGLLGGFAATEEWIRLSRQLGIGWWITSALESNVGLNAIAQFTARYRPVLHQGLGTGSLYHNNISSPLKVANGHLIYDVQATWDSKFWDNLPWHTVNA